MSATPPRSLSFAGARIAVECVEQEFLIRFAHLFDRVGNFLTPQAQLSWIEKVIFAGLPNVGAKLMDLFAEPDELLSCDLNMALGGRRILEVRIDVADVRHGLLDGLHFLLDGGRHLAQSNVDGVGPPRVPVAIIRGQGLPKSV